MNAEEKWQVVCRCDVNKDNIVYFDSPREAIDAGYRVCKRCRPDLQSYDPNRLLIRHIKEILDHNACNPQKLQEVLRQIPMTSHHSISCSRTIMVRLPMHTS